MRKIFILSILIAPIIAHATDRIGPEHDDEGWGGDYVIADDLGPYKTEEISSGDSTQVVSAAYVKGAYNDAIAAINATGMLVDSFENELDVKQNKLSLLGESNKSIYTYVLSGIDDARIGEDRTTTRNRYLINAVGVKNAVDAVNTTISNKRINILNTWGSAVATQVEIPNYVAP